MSEKHSTAGITLIDGTTVIVPNSLTLMTPYILYEQGDWFEDEIKFIREYVQPGMQVLDIGANYGVYTLSIANILGDHGKIWAFEPTSSTSSCLEKSISKNGFKNVELLKFGLSNRVGSAQFYTSNNSELNSLSKEAVPTGDTETIALETLNHCFESYGWNCLDIIKLDAEGEEVNIIEAADKLMASLSPLIMFELKHGKTVNVPLVTKFRTMGYSTYRLIPGLNVLVPFDETHGFDGYLLNLFCCKEDKTNSLEKRGVLIEACEAKAPNDFTNAAEYILSDSFCKETREILSRIESVEDSRYIQVLSSYIASLSSKYTLRERLSYLKFALNNTKYLLNSGVNDIGQLSTFSRIAFDAGERALGVDILSNLIQTYPDSVNFELSGPFLPADKQYDLVSCNADVKAWLFSSIIEKFIEKQAFSTYFLGKKVEPLFLRLRELGYMSEAMSRRYEVLVKVFQ